MILFPSSYTQHVGEHLVTAYPPGGGGRFRYVERVRPAIDFGTVVEKIIEQDPEFQVTSIGRMTRIVTQEGEYGALLSVSGMREHSPARHYIGAVFTEEFVATLDTLAIIPAAYQQFGRLSESYLRSVRLELMQRPRRFYYVPPPGWQALQSGLSTNWYPADYPRNRSNISIAAARVSGLSSQEMLQAQQMEAVTSGHSTLEPIHSKSGYEGHRLVFTYKSNERSPLIHREVALFRIEEYAYQMRLESMNESNLSEVQGIFRDVVDSFEPLPQTKERRQGRAMASLSSDAVVIWGE